MSDLEDIAERIERLERIIQTVVKIVSPDTWNTEKEASHVALAKEFGK